PPNPVTPGPAVSLEMLQPFVLYQPSHPTNIPAPVSELSRTALQELTQKNTGGARRRPVDIGTSSAGTKRLRVPDDPADNQPVLPPTVSVTSTVLTPGTSTPSLRYAACDCWGNLVPCDSEKPPNDVPREEILASDAQHLESKPFKDFRRPKTERVRCPFCFRDLGEWHTWLLGKGGVTGRIREHMHNRHPDDYRERCIKGGVNPLGVNLEDPKDIDFDIEYSPALLAERIAQLVAVNDLALRVVESREFRRVIALCGRAPSVPDRDIPHRSKLTKTIGELYRTEIDQMKVDLNNALGLVSATSDLWSDEKLRAFMAVTLHYINSEGHLAEHLFAFRRIEGRHTGANIGHELLSVFEEAGIINKIGHITLDNASNNNTLMASLESALAERGQRFGRDLNRIRCIPHIINLTVQAMLDALPAAAARFREEVAAKGDELDGEIEEYLQALESGVVDLCRESVKALRSSDIRRQGLRDLILDGNFRGLFRSPDNKILLVPVLELLRDCLTRWSSTYLMIFRYLELYPAIVWYAHRHPEMNIPVISHKQFEVLQDICSILSILHHAQELLSAEQTPTLSLALPVYEALLQALRDATYKFPELSYAIVRAELKLESYVVKTRDLPVYALAMVVNPCIRFRWMHANYTALQCQGFKVSVKDKMLEVRQAMHRASAQATPFPTQTASQRAASAQTRGYLRLLNVSASVTRASEARLRDHSGTAPHAEPVPTPLTPEELLTRHMNDVDTELLRWEQLVWDDIDVMGTVDLVEFWRKYKYEFPLLYRIAMDVLPVQASSVSSERVFSSSRLTCTRERSRLSPETVEQLQVLKHSLHRRRRTSEGSNQTLDFMAHIVNPPGSDELLDGDN
ncbi:unnamed protein product, partial [Rhizoctonia solani]